MFWPNNGLLERVSGELVFSYSDPETAYCETCPHCPALGKLRPTVGVFLSTAEVFHLAPGENRPVGEDRVNVAAFAQ